MATATANRSVDMAKYYLTNKDIEILEESYTCKAGSIELIAVEDEVLTFIKVETNTSEDTGVRRRNYKAPSRDKMEAIAVDYLTSHPRPSGRIRFDVISIKMTGEMQCMLCHHRDALSSD